MPATKKRATAKPRAKKAGTTTRQAAAAVAPGKLTLRAAILAALTTRERPVKDVLREAVIACGWTETPAGWSHPEKKGLTPLATGSATLGTLVGLGLATKPQTGMVRKTTAAEAKALQGSD
jgi:hypothetical protein